MADDAPKAFTGDRSVPRSPVLDVNIAFHYLGCARSGADGVHLPSRVGVVIDCLAEAVARLTVVAYDPPSPPSFEDGVEYTIGAPNVQFCSLGPKGSVRGYLSRRRRVARIVHKASADWDVLVLYLPQRRPQLVWRASSCRRLAALVVGTSAGVGGGTHTTIGSKLAAWLTVVWTERQRRAALRRSGVAIVNSEELRPEVEWIVPNTTSAQLSARRAWHSFEASDRLSGKGRNFLVAGRLTLEKGVIDAVEAFSLITRTLPDARLHIAGEGPALTAALQRAVELDVRHQVITYGWVPAGDELSALYREMDVLLLPSYADYEGFPYVIWEALAHSVLTICTRVGGVEHALEHERDVIFVPRRNPTAMANAVERLVDDPGLRRRLITSGLERARANTLETGIATIVDAIAATWPELAIATDGDETTTVDRMRTSDP